MTIKAKNNQNNQYIYSNKNASNKLKQEKYLFKNYIKLSSKR